VKFFCIADEDTVRGFRLAGIAGQVVKTAEQVAAAVEAATAETENSVIVLTEQVAAVIGPLVERIRLEREQPLIAEIPGPDGPMPGRKSLRQLVQEAVGIRVE
jgi:V/A-type H+-transporting ATPase subunit F